MDSPLQSPDRTRPVRSSLTRKPIPQSSVWSYGAASAPQDPSEAFLTDAGTTRGRSKSRSGASSKRRAIWLSEIVSFALALVAIGAIVALLVTHQNKPLPDWPALISVNSLIAIFTAVLKAALMFPIAEGISELKWVWFARPRPASDLDRFDAASRGPSGALMLLFKRPGNLLTSLGAAITILALAIDPFTQQIIQYYNCLTPVPNQMAAIPRTNNYTAAGGHNGAGTNAIDPALSLSLYEGLLSPPANASASISFHCPSGNCTFPESNGVAYHSVAICFDTEDLTDLIVSNSSGAHTLPSGLSLSTGDIVLVTGSPDEESPDEESIFSFEILSIVDGKPWAFGAYLYPCIHSYSGVNISRNILQEQIADKIPMVQGHYSADPEYYFSLAGDYPSTAGLDCTPSSQPEGNKTAPARLAPDGQTYFVDTTLGGNGSLADAQWYDPGCTYEFGTFTVNSLRDEASTFFGGPLNLNTVQQLDTTLNGPTWLLRLYGSGNTTLDSATAYVEGLANAMTAAVRQGGDTYNSAPAPGVILAGETCISVVWTWLALPASLALLTLVFLCATIAQSRQARDGAASTGRQPWKSSSLPLLFCGLPDQLREHYGTVDGVDRMKGYGDFLEVRLRRVEESEPQPGPGTGGEKEVGRWVLAENTRRGP